MNAPWIDVPDADKILSQSEVDALLSAIGSGEVEVAPEAAAEPAAEPYDFKRPQRVSRDQLRSIETLHEVFARNLQAALSGLLRTVVDVKVGRVDQLSFQEFIQSLPNPTVITVLSCEPLEGHFVLELNPSVAFPAIERLLGSGRAGGPLPERPVTRIEWNLIESVIGRALDLMREVWGSVAPVEFRVSARETDPPLVRGFSPNEAMVLVALEVSVGEQRGGLNLAFPVRSVEGHMEKIAAHSWLSARRRESAGQEAAVSRQLAPAEVLLSAHLPAGTMTLRELAGLRPGDLILTGHPKDAPLRLSVEGREKFDVKPGSLRDRKAFRVVAALEPGREAGTAAPRQRMSVRAAGGPESAEAAPALRPMLERLPLQGSVVLAEKTARLREAVGLRVGDVLEFPKRIDEPLELRVQGRPLAEGTAVRIGEKFGLQLAALRISPPPPRPPAAPAP